MQARILTTLFLTILLAGFLTPLHHEAELFGWKFVLILCSLAISCSGFIGHSWVYTTNAQTLNAPNCLEGLNTINKQASNYKYWMRILLPKPQAALETNWKSMSSAELTSTLLLSPIVFGLAILAISGLILVNTHNPSERGLFGALLQYKSGKGIANVFSLFLLMNSCSVLAAGLFSKIFNRVR